MSAQRQARIGIALSAAIIGAWIALHVYGVFFHRIAPGTVPSTLALAAILCWLSVGLFIVAHDAMHGSLAPGRPSVNRGFGRVALALYAGFWFDRLRQKHFEHHRRPGTADDPDFHLQQRLWLWYGGFIRRYFGWRQLAVLSLATALYLALGARFANVLLLWALPAILSSLQLFYFGTFLPHRQEEEAFADDHRARSSGLGYVASLLSCYHFGYHHEHHLAPEVPWWRLPDERRGRATVR